MNFYRRDIPVLIQQHAPYLQPGVYSVDPLGFYIKKTGKTRYHRLDTLWDILSLPISKRLLRSIFLFFMKKDVILLDSGHIFPGSIMKYDLNHNEFKFFDFHNAKVMTLYSSTKRAMHDYSANLYFSKFFNTPLLEKASSNILLEQLIPAETNPAEQTLLLLTEQYLSYFSFLHKENKVDYVDFLSLRQTLAGDKFGIMLLNEAEAKLPGNIPVVLLHGDCWSSNVIFSSDGRPYLIDFERSDNHFYLYDFFMYLYCEMQFRNNNKILWNYFEGKYDSLLGDLSSRLAFNYDSSMRCGLFLLFLCCYYIEHPLRGEERNLKKFCVETRKMLNHLPSGG